MLTGSRHPLRVTPLVTLLIAAEACAAATPGRVRAQESAHASPSRHTGKHLTPVRIGVLAKRSPERRLAQSGLTAEYLTNEIPGFYLGRDLHLAGEPPYVDTLPIDAQYASKKKLVPATRTFSKHPDIAGKFMAYASSEKGRGPSRKYGLFDVK